MTFKGNISAMTAFSTQYNHQPEGLSNDIGPRVRFFLEKQKSKTREELTAPL